MTDGTALTDGERSARAAGARTLCFCFDVTEAAVRAHFARGGDYDTLVERTGIGTRCTACLLDLDVVLDRIHQARTPGPATVSGPAAATQAGLLVRPTDWTDSGFLVCDAGIKTVLRIVNHPLLFEADWPVPVYDYSLRLFDETGRARACRSGFLGAGAELSYELATMPSCPPRGWFLIRLRPRSRGVFGSIRPYVVLEGPTWTTAYHTQPQAMASTLHHRTRVAIAGNGKRLAAAVSLINAARARTTVCLKLSDPGGAHAAEAELSLDGHASTIIDLDQLFTDMPCDRALTLEVTSTQPTRRHIIGYQANGAWNVDHFPN